MARFFVNSTYLAALGQVSEILDRESPRRILIAGMNHQERAKARAASLNAGPVVDERRSRPPCPGASPRRP